MTDQNQQHGRPHDEPREQNREGQNQSAPQQGETTHAPTGPQEGHS